MPHVLSHLSKRQKKQINNLAEECILHDGGGVPLYLESDADFNMEIRCFYLLYKKRSLVSFLSLFITDGKNAEVTAYTRPAYRRRGYYGRLLKAARQELKGKGIEKLWLVADGEANKARELDKKNFSKKFLEFFSEYLLVFDNSTIIPVSDKVSLVKELDIHFTKKTKNELFPEVTALVDLNIKAEIEAKSDKDSKSFNFTDKENNLIGIAEARFDESRIYIFNFGIIPDKQGIGYGKAALNTLLLAMKETNKPIMLQVSSTNQRAYKLYTDNGFIINKQRDYYLIWQNGDQS